MPAFPELLAHLQTLETTRARIGNEGEVLLDCWLAQSKPAGTARTSKAHWQLRSRKPQFNGKRSQYVKAAAVGQYQAAIARGQQLKQLDRQIARLQQQIAKIEAMIAKAG